MSIETKTLGDGTMVWLEDGLRHRENAPAVVHPDGTKEWWSHGEHQFTEGRTTEAESKKWRSVNSPPDWMKKIYR